MLEGDIGVGMAKSVNSHPKTIVKTIAVYLNPATFYGIRGYFEYMSSPRRVEASPFLHRARQVIFLWWY